MDTSDRDKAKAIILEIIKQSGGHFKGKTKLYKAFYWAHGIFARRHEETLEELSEWPIVHMPNGPGVESGNALLTELEKDGYLKCSTDDWGYFYKDNGYTLTGKIFNYELLPDAIDAIKTAAIYVIGHTATALSELTHELSKSWNYTKNGEHMNIHHDLMSDEDFEALKKTDWMKDAVKDLI